MNIKKNKKERIYIAGGANDIIKQRRKMRKSKKETESKVKRQVSQEKRNRENPRSGRRQATL